MEELSWESYNQLIRAHSNMGRPDLFLSLLSSMEALDMRPSVSAYVPLIRSLGDLGRTHEAEALLLHMRSSGLTPALPHYNALLRAFLARGQLSLACFLLLPEFNYMKLHFPVKSIGPTLPSTYLDNRLPSDSRYSINLHTPDTAPYIDWLNTKPRCSVVYLSFGSMASLSPQQTVEIASALKAAGRSFLWVVRTSESSKLPNDFLRDVTADKGLVVTWCNQLDVLAHPATGCFVTHCGWNSTMEGIGVGVPMVGMPQWTDQPTDAKYVEDVWRVGVRANADDGGLVSGVELERCIEAVMDGEGSGDIRSNAAKWSKLAKEAVSDGGSTNKCILEFLDECCK